MTVYFRLNHYNFLMDIFVNKIKQFVYLFCLATLIDLCSFNVQAKEDLSQRLQDFADKMEQDYQFDSSQILNTLKSLQPKQNIIAKMNRPAESLPWHRYRPIWMKDKRISGGVDFYQQYQTELEKAEKKYGVDKMIITAIIGIESFYGSHQGSYPVLDALYTLGFHYPKRAPFFKSELAQYFLLAREQQWNLSDIKGSYAGAMGMGQFISSSYRAYGVDFNQDGTVDLFNDPVDMIGSVANYFNKHGWIKDGFVAKKMVLNNQQATQLVQKKLQLNKPLTELAAFGISVEEIKHKDAKVAIFALKQKNFNEHWLVANNFYSITRYNHNAMYALAAFQLSEAIKQQMTQQKTTQQIKPAQ
jgi:membrane-bound lytic murein transglycosylase B